MIEADDMLLLLLAHTLTVLLFLFDLLRLATLVSR
jgi:hypothetical protein